MQRHESTGDKANGEIVNSYFGGDANRRRMKNKSTALLTEMQRARKYELLWIAQGNWRLAKEERKRDQETPEGENGRFLCLRDLLADSQSGDRAHWRGWWSPRTAKALLSLRS